MKIVAISGSLRKGSFNSALIETSRKLAPPGMEIQRVHIDDLPPYNMDLEESLPESVARFHSELRSADGFLFTVPEHNFSYPGVLKNAIDWGSRPPGTTLWNGKPIILQSAAAGWAGGLRAQYHLHQVLGYFEMRLQRFPEICIGAAHKKFDAELNLLDEMALNDIRKQLAHFAELVAAST